MAGLHAQAGSDGRGQRHHGGGSGVDQLARVYHVVVGVGQHHKTFLDQDAGGFQQSGVVRKQCLLVPDHFQLDPVGQAHLARQHGDAHGVVGGVAAGGVGQDENPGAVDVIEERFLGAVGEVHAAHGDSHHFRARSFVTILHLL